jgi:cobaltochelatase CobN
MHLLRVESRSIDGSAEPVDLGQSPADIVALSFADTDLAVLAAAWETGQGSLPSLRLANLTALRHPYSVDLYAGKVLSKARFVLVRLLGGMDYWRYGVDELATLARSSGCHLAIVPGDHREDARLDEASTLHPTVLRQIGSYFAAGGVANVGACLRFIAGHLSPQAPPPVAAPTYAFGFFAPTMIRGTTGGPSALIVFYRTWMLAADTEPVEVLARELASRGFQVTAIYVTSLKDPAAIAPLTSHLQRERPDIILNLTAFSARSDAGGSVLDQANAPVLQFPLSGGSHRQWMDSTRGLGPADLAMNVVLPELDGRIIAGAISFKGETRRYAALEYTRLVHQPDSAGISYAADLALNWVRLANTPRSERRLACILSDYPAKAGRTGYAVGLDTPRSVVAIASRLAREGYAATLPLDEAGLITALSASPATPALSLADYERLLATLPVPFVDQLHAAWGEPATDDAIRDGSFWLRITRAGNLLICVQPDRGHATFRNTDYHDASLPPRHSYVAFYLWLRMVEQVHAVIHCGTHGTLEWLPGKATALSDSCAPRAVLGPTPLIYPFIVNNPGEAAQAKRRIAAVTVGHLTPPLMAAGTHGATAELEQLLDEYSEAQTLDSRRATRLAELILAQARATGLATESGLAL